MISDSRENCSGLREMEALLGYGFRNPELLKRALTHASWGVENNERLEFLGDSVLGLVVGKHLYTEDADAAPSDLATKRSYMVSNAQLAEAARQLGITDFLRVGKGVAQAGQAKNTSVLANALEAILGAVFADGGLDAAENVFARVLAPVLAREGARQDAVEEQNPKSALQELLAELEQPPPRYVVEGCDGPPHDRRWWVECALEDPAVSFRGSGATKQEASIKAARMVLKAVKQ